MNIKEEIAKLHLPPHSYMVVGSSIFGALGIRESDDIDLIVSQEVFQHFIDLGWRQEIEEAGIILKHDPFDVGRHWEGKEIDAWLPRATVINDVPYLSLTDLRKWKVRRARPKDLVDVKLIDDYLKTHPEAR